MESEKTDQPAPHAGQREPGTRQDGEAMPPQAVDPRPSGRPNSEKDPAFRPPDDSEKPGKAPSPATADDEFQRPEGRLEEVEGLTDNSAGG